MQTIGLLKEKGGAGATTLAIHLAVAARDAGRRPVILDTDPQGSLQTWKQARASEDPPIYHVDYRLVAKAIQVAREDEEGGYDLIIIDTPPYISAATEAVARVVDLAIVPTRPGPLDLPTVPKTLRIIEEAGCPAHVVVLNACPHRAPEIREARAFLTESLHAPVWEGEITDRRVFSRALQSGLAVTEMLGGDADLTSPEGRALANATREITALWDHVEELLSAGVRA